MFVKTEIIKFQGFNSNVAPELIDNTEARDIYNFRMEKIGKIVSRNGYYTGLFADQCQFNLATPRPFCNLQPGDVGYPEMLRYMETIRERKNAYIKNKGIIGIGELILSSKWESIDSDRVMVYFIRYGQNSEYNQSYVPAYKDEVNNAATQQSYGGFLFSPMSGIHKDKLLYGNLPEELTGITDPGYVGKDESYNLYNSSKTPTVDIFDRQWHDPHYRVSMDKLYAPNKTYDVADGPWINQHTDMSQYRHKLVISDKINGDMLIQDEYSEEYDPEQDNKHKLTLRPNALETFDVNIVDIDYRLAADQENGTGVRQGMGLYNYELPKKQQKMSIDNVDGDYTLSDENWLGWGTGIESGQTISPEQLRTQLLTAHNKSVAMFPAIKTKLKYYGLYGYRDAFKNDANRNGTDPHYYRRKFGVNDYDYSRFTNAETESEFYDAFARVQLKEEEYIDEDGEKQVDRPADVYIWEDFQIDYVVSSGKTLGRFFLAELDKQFTKANAGLTKVFKIEEIDEYGRQVPLGMWKYRFVWDFGNGVYSAPSAEIQVPDMLWSAIPDFEMTQVTHGGVPAYDRPRTFGNTYNAGAMLNVPEFADTYQPTATDWYDPTQVYNKVTYPALLIAGKFSTLGSLFYDIKATLYKDKKHKYGVTGSTKALDEQIYWQAISNPNNLTARKAFGDFQTILTMFFSASDVVTRGAIYEGVEIGIIQKTDDPAFWEPTTLDDLYYYTNANFERMRPRVAIPGVYLQPHFSQLRVPIFKSNNQQYTYNALFDDEGRFRLIYSTGTTSTVNETVTIVTKSFEIINMTQWAEASYNLATNIRWENGRLKFRWGAHITIPKPGEGVFWDINIRTTADPSDRGHVVGEILGGDVANRNITVTKPVLENGRYWSDIEFDWDKAEFGLYIWFYSIISERYYTYIKLDIRQDIIATDDDDVLRHLVFPGTYPMLGTIVDLSPQKNSPQAPIEMRGHNRIVGAPPLVHYSKHKRHQSDDIYLNIVCKGKQNTLLDNDKNNAGFDDFPWNNPLTIYARPYNLMRAVKNEMSRLINITVDLDSEAVSRLVLKDLIAEIYALNKEHRLYMASEYWSWTNISEDLQERKLAKVERSFFSYADTRTVTHVAEDMAGEFLLRDDINQSLIVSKFYKNTPDPTQHFTNNMDVIVYGQAERLIAIEQLTSYFPSSLIHKSPRLGIFIHNNDIPPNAKNLMIFRTKNALDNSYQSNVYGLVDKVELDRMTEAKKNGDMYDAAGSIKPPNQQRYYGIKIGDVYTEKRFRGTIDSDDRPEDTIQMLEHGVYFFDKTTDAALDFSYSPDNYDGFRKALWSRFNTNMYERSYYANFFEEYNPLAPKGYKESDLMDAPLAAYGDVNLFDISLPSVIFSLVESDEGYGYVGGTGLIYCYYYVDHAGIRGPERYLRVYVDGDSTKTYVVVLAGIPSSYSDSISHVDLFVNTSPPGDNFEAMWEFVAKVEPESMGIVVDKGILESKHKTKYVPNRQEYRGGVRWSEPYQPDWIKYDSFIEVKSGDGKHITGLNKIYGNLIIFKEDSIHRTTLQNADPPLSRWDEVTAEYGCIAPNTLINIDNTLYFLSWKGLCKYDNNQLTKIDGKFAEELQFIIESNKAQIRDASCGYNPYFNELYLNVPIAHDQPFITETQEMYFENDDFGIPVTKFRTVITPDRDNTHRIQEKRDNFYHQDRYLFSHIFVIKLDTGSAFKFGYQPTLVPPQNSGFDYIKKTVQPNAMIRKYYNDSLGNMRSADILPSNYGDTLDHAGIFIETPYNVAERHFKDTDTILDAYYYATNPSEQDLLANQFPATYEMAVRSAYRSKFFTGDDETQIKRLRQIVMNLYSRGIVLVDMRYLNYDSSDARIDNLNYLPQEYEQIMAIDKYRFNPTESRTAGIYAESNNAPGLVGTLTNILNIIPNSNFAENEENIKKIFDINGKPIKFAIDIFTEYRTQLNELSYYWRPIHNYLS